MLRPPVEITAKADIRAFPSDIGCRSEECLAALRTKLPLVSTQSARILFRERLAFLNMTYDVPLSILLATALLALIKYSGGGMTVTAIITLATNAS